MRLRLTIQFLAISFVLLQNIVPASKLADDIKISNYKFRCFHILFDLNYKCILLSFRKC